MVLFPLSHRLDRECNLFSLSLSGLSRLIPCELLSKSVPRGRGTSLTSCSSFAVLIPLQLSIFHPLSPTVVVLFFVFLTPAHSSTDRAQDMYSDDKDFNHLSLSSLITCLLALVIQTELTVQIHTHTLIPFKRTISFLLSLRLLSAHSDISADN